MEPFFQEIAMQEKSMLSNNIQHSEESIPKDPDKDGWEEFEKNLERWCIFWGASEESLNLSVNCKSWCDLRIDGLAV